MWHHWRAQQPLPPVDGGLVLCEAAAAQRDLSIETNRPDGPTTVGMILGEG